MTDHIYRVIEVVGSSDRSSDDAIRNALERANKTVRGIRWFEVMQTRGHVAEDHVCHFQVTIKLGFTLDASEHG
ncbi:MAG: dodecin family protein [Sphingomicrobium sp.]